MMQDNKLSLSMLKLELQCNCFVPTISVLTSVDVLRFGAFLVAALSFGII